MDKLGELDPVLVQVFVADVLDDWSGDSASDELTEAGYVV